MSHNLITRPASGPVVPALIADVSQRVGRQAVMRLERGARAFGVRVNALCPGMVQTPLNRGVYESWAREQPESDRPSYEEWTAEKIQKLVPLNRWQEPEDIAAMAVFLASSRGRNITGQTINVDGGYVMHW